MTSPSAEDLKVFNDPIHGHMEIHPLLVKVIDTPQFQRLRYIKQLGGCYFVFPGAAHNRFEHSLGVSHLAGILAETLKSRQPELGITDKDVLCVQMAGLCHDLGHGPFSHVWDNMFMKEVRPDLKWKHEQASSMMFEHLIEDGDLMKEFEKFELDENDITFVKEQIEGPLNSCDKQYKGRTEDKYFLYEIVANKRNGIDVDKWDYFARDCHNLGISNNFDCHRFMKFMRVIEVDGEKQICPRNKEVENVYDMFHTRRSLHRRAYQHKVTKVVEIMMVEALVKANDHYKLSGTNGKSVKMSEAVDDMVAYTKLTDDVIQEIRFSADPNLAASRDILEKIHKRQLYKCVGQAQSQSPANSVNVKKPIPEMLEEIAGSLSEEEPEGSQLSPDNLVLLKVNFNYGMDSKNPIDQVKFYNKLDINKAILLRKEEVSMMLPARFAEQEIRLYCKLPDQDSISKAEKCFKKWCANEDLNIKPQFTPHKPDQGNSEESRPRDGDVSSARKSLFQ